MDTITLKRGDREVTFTKLKSLFGIRLRQGRAASEKALESACGRCKAAVRHVDSVRDEKMELFAIEKAAALDGTMEDLRKAPASEVVSHLYSLDGPGGSMVIPTGTLTVQFRSTVGKEKREEILGRYGLEVIEDLDFLPGGYTVRLSAASTENPLKIAAHLLAIEEVAVAEPDLGFQAALHATPSDTLYPEQWHLHNRGDRIGLKEGADVKAEGAWDITRGSAEITVCVMDDGFDLSHPDFDAPWKIVAPRDFGQDDTDPSPVEQEDNHGTSCAGVAIAMENGSGVVGLAPGCTFMPVRMSLWLTDDAVTRLFEYAIDNGADVISCSWSAGVWDFPLSTKISRIIHKAATEGRDGKGCVILFAAGNDDRPLDGRKNGQVSHQGFALHPDVIAVAASNSLDERSSYSNYGQELEICAPSSGSPGRPIVTTDRVGAAGYSAYGYTATFGGTSSATPLAAGLAALILSVNGELTATKVREILMETADKIDQDRGEYVDGHSKWYGHGRINAENAVKAALQPGPMLPETLYMERRISKGVADFRETSDAIEFPLDVKVEEIEVRLDIRHTWIGDLRVAIQPPDGERIVLHDKAGGGQDDIVRTYRSGRGSTLFENVLGSSAKGTWVLTIEDTAREDQGSLLKWGVGITYRTA